MKQNQLPLSAGPDFERRVQERVEAMKNDDTEISLVVSWASGQREGQEALKKMCLATNDHDIVAAANGLRDLVNFGFRHTAERTVRVTDTRKNMENGNEN